MRRRTAPSNYLRRQIFLILFLEPAVLMNKTLGVFILLTSIISIAWLRRYFNLSKEFIKLSQATLPSSLLTDIDVALCLSVYLKGTEKVDALIYTLNSLPGMQVFWRRVLIFAQLEAGLEYRREEISTTTARVFKGMDWNLSWTRPHTQSDWRPIIDDLASTDRMVWFFQNHDHFFVDKDPSVLHEGIRLVSSDPYPFRSIYLSHWPEALRVSGKLHNEVFLPPHYVMFTATIADSVQIFSSSLLRFIFIDTIWNFTTQIRRIDDLMGDQEIWGEWFSNYFRFNPPWSDPTILRKFAHLMHIYVPLREQFRHIDGYGHAKISESLFSSVRNFSKAPLEYSYDSNSGIDELVLRMLPPHKSLWTENNNYTFPKDIIKGMLDAHYFTVDVEDIVVPHGAWP
jgi:hypothetical protein